MIKGSVFSLGWDFWNFVSPNFTRSILCHGAFRLDDGSIESSNLLCKQYIQKRHCQKSQRTSVSGKIHTDLMVVALTTYINPDGVHSPSIHTGTKLLIICLLIQRNLNGRYIVSHHTSVYPTSTPTLRTVLFIHPSGGRGGNEHMLLTSAPHRTYHIQLPLTSSAAGFRWQMGTMIDAIACVQATTQHAILGLDCGWENGLLGVKEQLRLLLEGVQDLWEASGRHQPRPGNR